MKEKTKGNILIFLTALLWSFLGICDKSALSDGLVVAGAVSLFAFIVVRLCFIKRKFKFNKFTVVTGIVLALMNLTFFAANKMTTVTNTIVLQYSSPIFVLIINMVFFRYKPRRQQVGALTVCMGGMIIFFCGQLSAGNMLGNIIALSSGVFFAISFIFNAMPQSDPFSSTLINHFLTFLTGLVCFIFLKGSFVPSDTVTLAFTGIFISGFSSVCYSLGMEKTSALNANMIALSEVFMTPLWAHFIFHEAIGRFSLIGITLMLSSIIFESYFESKSAANILQNGFGGEK